MSHQPAVASSHLAVESPCNTQCNALKGARTDHHARTAARHTAELPATSRHGPEKNALRFVGAPGVAQATTDNGIKAASCSSDSSHRSLQLAALPPHGVNPRRLAVARWSLAVVRLIQILVCAFCAWFTAESAHALDGILTQSQAAALLHTLLLVFSALCSLVGALDLLWLLLVVRPGWRRPIECCGDKPYSVELTCDVLNIGVWFALLLSILVQRLWDQWRGIAGTLLLAALHGVSAGLVVWRRLQDRPVPVGSGTGAAQQAVAPGPPQHLTLTLLPLPMKHLSGRTSTPATAPTGARSSQYKVPARP